MKFQFENITQLFVMDGHGVFVWTAVLVSLVVMLWLIVKPLADSRSALKDVSGDITRAALTRGDA
ncbi:MAG: heme exporter protein CcmD [Porticoccaceae bacterium]|nr:heme exporter protein CcmD [Porticoccaceae bacterium]MDG1308599.1 heme exporter protein CcmD [Porticoccaceae bacterium]